LKSTPTLNNPPNTTPTSLNQTTPIQNQEGEPQQVSQGGLANNDLDFLASLEADFDGYQYLPFTLLDPQGKIVVPHDLFYDPHEFPDTHYANLFSSDPNLTFPNDPVATSFNTNQTSIPNDGEFANLYQGFVDFPTQDTTNWSAMGRAPSNSGQVVSSPFPKDRLPMSNTQPPVDTNWYETFQANTQNQQGIMPPFRPSNNNPAATTPFNNISGFGATPNENNGTTPNGGKWMFEFRNSSYGYFPNLPAVGDMHSS
jgi:hypothetical protein